MRWRMRDEVDEVDEVEDEVDEVEEEEEPENHQVTAVKRGSVSKVIAFVCSYAAQSRPSFPIVITRTLLSRGLA